MRENKFHIVADENAVGLQEIASHLGTLDLLPAERIDAQALQQADALIVRSVTRVDGPLLEGTPVQFVGSAKIGRASCRERVKVSVGGERIERMKKQCVRRRLNSVEEECRVEE